MKQLDLIRTLTGEHSVVLVRQWAETLVGAPTAVGAYKLKVETDEETGAVRLFAKGVAGMMILLK